MADAAPSATDYKVIVSHADGVYTLAIPELLLAVHDPDLQRGYAELNGKVEQTVSEARRLGLLDVPAPLGIADHIRMASVGLPLHVELTRFAAKTAIVFAFLALAALPILPAVWKTASAVSTAMPAVQILIDRTRFAWQSMSDPAYSLTPEEQEHFLRRSEVLAQRTRPYLDALAPVFAGLCRQPPAPGQVPGQAPR